MKNIIKFSRIQLLLFFLLVAGILFLNRSRLKTFVGSKLPSLVNLIRREETVSSVIAKYGDSAKKRLLPYFERAEIAYPPEGMVIAVIKKERILHLYAKNRGGGCKLIRSYPLLASSGRLGPKLREGDLQIPEGIYKITSFNPNSCYHLSMKINYPNNFDAEKAELEGRDRPGNDIFIHGKAASIGCVSIGDAPIEELFLLCWETGTEKIRVIISPVDFRKDEMPEDSTPKLPAWTDELYANLRKELLSLGDESLQH